MAIVNSNVLVSHVMQMDTEVVSSIFCALESIHAALAVMAYNGMPKQLYKEEVCSELFLFFPFTEYIL